MTTAIVDEEIAGNEEPVSKKICLEGDHDGEPSASIRGSANNSIRVDEHKGDSRGDCAQLNKSSEVAPTQVTNLIKIILKYSCSS